MLVIVFVAVLVVVCLWLCVCHCAFVVMLCGCVLCAVVRGVSTAIWHLLLRSDSVHCDLPLTVTCWRGGGEL